MLFKYQHVYVPFVRDQTVYYIVYVININTSYICLFTVEYLSVSCLRPDGAGLEESQSEVNFKTFH